MISTFIWIIVTLLVIYLLLVLLMYLFQSKIIFQPAYKLPFTPGDINLDYEEVQFKSSDGIDLSGWFIPGTKARGTVLFQHGNAGNMSGRLETIRLLHQFGLNVFIYDYRGYGKSQGKTTERGTYNDALAAWRYLVQGRMLSEDQIILMGRSLGAAITAWLATQVRPAAVILESTFTSAPDLAADLYPMVPVRRMIRYLYPNNQYIKLIHVPVWIAHSVDDDLIPFTHGRELHRLANEPKTFFEMKGTHGNGFLETGTPYKNALNTFIEDIFGQLKTSNKGH